MKLRYLFAALCLCLLLASPAAAAGGSGTAANPYIIETAAELQSMQNNLLAYYQLANDIDLSGVTWTPIGSSSSPFSGQFDGGGNTINNLALSSSSQSSGFFGTITSGAVIKDVTFQDCAVSSSSPQCGVVIGSIIMSSSAHETAVISNVNLIRCSVSVSNNVNGCLIGLISTSAVVEITNCDISYCDATTTGTGRYIAGCMIGQCTGSSSAEITGCNILYSHARASGSYAGGFVASLGGSSSIIIDSSTVQNSIIESVSSNYVGGFAGECSGKASLSISNSKALNCIIKGQIYIGGVIGVCDGSGTIINIQMVEVIDCTIVSSDKYAGGIVGGCSSGTSRSFTGCTVTDSTIIAPTYAAGICPILS